MPNPPFDARDSFFSLTDTAGAVTTFSAFLTSIDGLPGARDLLDTSKIGDSGHTFTPSLFNGTIIIEGLYGDTGSPSVQTKLAGILGMSTASVFEYAPTGDASGASPVNQSFTGTCLMRNLTNTGRVNTAITFRGELQVQGVFVLQNSSDV